MPEKIPRRGFLGSLWKGAKAAAGISAGAGLLDLIAGSTAHARSNRVRVFDGSGLENVIAIDHASNPERIILPPEEVEIAEQIGLTPDRLCEYMKNTNSNFRKISYFHFLGIAPKTIRDYYVAWLPRYGEKLVEYRVLDFDSFIIKSELKQGNISARASKVFDEYNIENPQRYSTRIMLSLEKNLGKQKTGKPTALIIYNKNDYNLAFDDNSGFIESLMGGYNLLLYEESRNIDVIRTIRDVGKRFGKIDLLLLGGHGKIKSINFGGGFMGDLSTADRYMMTGLDKYFDSDSVIILESCETGLGGPDAKNIAGTLKKCTKATVFAPEVKTEIASFEFLADGRVARPVYCQEGITQVF